MKKFIVILFLFIYVSSVTELHEVFKMPVLFAHFIEHKENSKDLSLWQFLCLHYAAGNVADADHAKDMQLPFKSHCELFGFTAPVYYTPVFSCFVKPIAATPVKIQARYAFSVSPAYLSSIWQPPKSC